MIEYKFHDVQKNLEDRIQLSGIEYNKNKPITPKIIDSVSDNRDAQKFSQLCQRFSEVYKQYISVSNNPDFQNDHTLIEQKHHLQDQLNQLLKAFLSYLEAFYINEKGPFFSYKITEKLMSLLNDKIFVNPSPNTPGTALQCITSLLWCSKTDLYKQFLDLGLSDRLWTIANENSGIVYEFALQGLVEMCWFSPESCKSVLQNYDFDLLPLFFTDPSVIKTDKTILFYSEILRYSLLHITSSDYDLVENSCNFFIEIIRNNVQTAIASAYYGLVKALNISEVSLNVWELIKTFQGDIISQVMTDSCSQELTILQSVYRFLSVLFFFDHKSNDHLLVGWNYKMIVDNLTFQSHEEIKKSIVKEAASLLFDIINSLPNDELLRMQLTDHILIELNAFEKIKESFQVSPYGAKLALLKLTCLIVINSSAIGKRKLIQENVTPLLLYSLSLEDEELILYSLKGIKLLLLEASEMSFDKNDVLNVILNDDNGQLIVENGNSDNDDISRLAREISCQYKLVQQKI